MKALRDLWNDAMIPFSPWERVGIVVLFFAILGLLIGLGWVIARAVGGDQ